jgi:hypothetical protein
MDIFQIIAGLFRWLNNFKKFSKNSRRIRLEECVPVIAMIAIGVIFLRAMQRYDPLNFWIVIIFALLAISVSQGTKRIIWLRQKSNYVRRSIVFLLKDIGVSFIFVFGFDHDKTIIEIVVDRIDVPVKYSNLIYTEAIAISAFATILAILTAPLQFAANQYPVGWKFRFVQFSLGCTFAYFLILPDQLLLLIGEPLTD